MRLAEKDPGAGLWRLSNRERTLPVDRLRPEYSPGSMACLLCALVKSACRGRYRACYVRMPDLAEQVEAAALKPGGPAKLVRKYSAYTLLAIDEWLVDKPDERFRRFLLDLMELRYDNASTAFATQLATKEWHSRLGGDTIADAILDRIVHNTVWIDTGEFNMRQRHGQSMLES